MWPTSVDEFYKKLENYVVLIVLCEQAHCQLEQGQGSNGSEDGEHQNNLPL